MLILSVFINTQKGFRVVEWVLMFDVYETDLFIRPFYKNIFGDLFIMYIELPMLLNATEGIFVVFFLIV